jgi:hypothetical protein
VDTYELTCQYCGNSWQHLGMPKEEIRCFTCNDSNIRVRNLSVDKIDYYKGSPPFDEEQNWNF